MNQGQKCSHVRPNLFLLSLSLSRSTTKMEGKGPWVLIFLFKQFKI